MGDTLVVMGAYGRRYNDGRQALKDWEDGKDFLIVGGPYCSVRDTPTMIRDGWQYVRIMDFDVGSVLLLKL
jgi:hypothetical protein